MVKRLFFLILTFTLLSFTAHKYYVSVSEIQLNSKTKTFEISIKFSGHDLEHSLENAGAPELYLGTEKENKKANDYLKQYIIKKFKIITNGKQLNYNFIGKEVNNDDFIYCYLESEKVESLKKIRIENNLLTELFNEQENIVYLTITNKKYSYTFNKIKVSETVEIAK